jgi:hypothetical protein
LAGQRQRPPHRLWGLRLSEWDALCWDATVLECAEAGRAALADEALDGMKSYEEAGPRLFAAQIIAGG